MDKKNYCNLYIVRHGQTDWNVRGILQGQTDTLLNKTGEKQAQELSKKLKKINFAVAFSSDLLRTKRTAEIIDLEKKLAIRTTKALMERYFGRFQGKPASDLEYQKIITGFSKLSQKERFQSKPYEGYESDEELMDRFIPFVREVSVAYPGKNILIVTHGGVIRVFLTHLGWASYETLPPGSINNAAYVKILCDGVDFIVEETFGFAKKLPE